MLDAIKKTKKIEILQKLPFYSKWTQSDLRYKTNLTFNFGKRIFYVFIQQMNI